MEANKIKGYPAEILRSMNYMPNINSKFQGTGMVIIISDRLPQVEILPEWSAVPLVKIVETKEFDETLYHAEPVEPGKYVHSGMFIYLEQKDFNMLCRYPIPLFDVENRYELQKPNDFLFQ